MLLIYQRSLIIHTSYSIIMLFFRCFSLTLWVLWCGYGSGSGRKQSVFLQVSVNNSGLLSGNQILQWWLRCCCRRILTVPRKSFKQMTFSAVHRCLQEIRLFPSTSVSEYPQGQILQWMHVDITFSAPNSLDWQSSKIWPLPYRICKCVCLCISPYLLVRCTLHVRILEKLVTKLI